MRSVQLKWTANDGWTPAPPESIAGEADLVLIFGSRLALQDPILFQSVQKAAGNALLFGCSTAGEICGTRVFDDSLILTAVQLDSMTVQSAGTPVRDSHDSYDAGKRLAGAFQHAGLSHVVVLADGLEVNGSALAAGLQESFPVGVTITGGLAGDGDRFQETVTILGGPPTSKSIAALGIYGTQLKVGYGSKHGWDPFGPQRLITNSEGNVLFELDGRSALELYKEYLGEHAADLPASGLFFPLSIRTRSDKPAMVRTIVSIDETQRSMTFAGDIPRGSYARLMKGNFNRLIEAAGNAARQCTPGEGGAPPSLALLVSCVGRKRLLRQRVEEEVEEVRTILPNAALTGFYSYGEITPFGASGRCELHNQTMTITSFTEL